MKSKGLPWEKAKGFDGSAVLGKWIKKESLEDIQNLDFTLLKNGIPVQEGNTQLMLWKIDEIIAYVSKFFMLKKGDIVNYKGQKYKVLKIVLERVWVPFQWWYDVDEIVHLKSVKTGKVITIKWYNYMANNKRYDEMKKRKGVEVD